MRLAYLVVALILLAFIQTADAHLPLGLLPAVGAGLLLLLVAGWALRPKPVRVRVRKEHRPR